MIETAAGLLNPVRVSADILKALAARATEALAGELDGVVITVPAYFDDAQRQGTKDAARLAGLHVLRLLNEPTAAAIAYGLDSGQEGVIAVYDLGGGTFDISILRLSRGVFEVLATGGDSALGGDDFDHLLADYIREQAGIPDRSDNRVQRELLDAAIAAKIALSDADSVTVNVAGWQGEISREQFNELIAPLVKRTLLACRRALKDAGVEADEVLEVVMVGGSTRVPLVRERVGEFFGRPPLTSIDPDKVVAIGAAIQADILVGNKPDSEMLLLDVIPLSLGLETMGGLVEKVIPRNTTIPVARAQDFTTFKDGQTAMSIHVMQGERELVQDCRSLARFALRGIPALPAGGAHIRVTFQVDADGLLSVTAMEKSTGVEASIQVKPSYGLTDSEIASMIKDSMSYAEQDVKARMLAEQKVEAARVLESLHGALAADAALLSAAERQVIDDAAAHLSEVAQGDDVDAIEQAIKNVDKQTRGFRRSPHGPVGSSCAERPFRGRGLICQRLLFCLIRISALMALFWKLIAVKPFSTQLCVTVSRLNTPVKNPVLAPPATASFVKVLTHCRKAQSRKTTCWTKHWGLEPESRLSCQARVTDEDLVVEIPRYTINHAREH